MFPPASMATPCGMLKLAAVPVPFILPAAADPANTLVTPAGVILLTRLPVEIYTLPEASTTAPLPPKLVVKVVVWPYKTPGTAPPVLAGVKVAITVPAV